MIELLRLLRHRPAAVADAFRASDPQGEAALNGLLYGAGALLTSSVLLVTSSPPVLGVVLALVPWLLLAGLSWWWIAPAVRNEVTAERQTRRRLERAREMAVEILLDEGVSQLHRRVAADYLLDHGDDRTMQRLLRGDRRP